MVHTLYPKLRISAVSRNASNTLSVVTTDNFEVILGVDNELAVKSVLHEVLGIPIPIHVFVDSRTLFNFVVNFSKTLVRLASVM